MSKSFQSYKAQWFLIFTLALFAILRTPSLIEPHWYGDEGIYQVIGRALNEGRVLYKEIWDNKPPLLYLIYAWFNGQLFFVKAASLIVGLFSIISFYFLTGEIYKKIASRFVSTFIYSILFALPILEGNIANAENFMLLFITLAAFLVLRFSKKQKLHYLFFAGFFLSIALITKIVAVFDFLAFCIFIFIFLLDRSKEILKTLKPISIFSLSTAFLLLFSSFYFLIIGAFPDFLSGVFSENVNYVNVSNNFIFPLGMLLAKTILLLLFAFLIFKNRKDLARFEVFIYVWVIFSIYSAFFSQRPYTHYILVMLPSFSLVVGKLIEEKKKKILDIAIVAFMIFVSIFNFKLYTRTIAYYKNYIDFMIGSKKLDDYYAFFDPQTPKDYEIASFINLNTTDNDKVFIWSNNAQIYAMTDKLPIGKYTAAYHITFYKNADRKTIEEVDLEKPKYIIQISTESMPRGILANYGLRYETAGAKIYERKI